MFYFSIVNNWKSVRGSVDNRSVATYLNKKLLSRILFYIAGLSLSSIHVGSFLFVAVMTKCPGCPFSSSDFSLQRLFGVVCRYSSYLRVLTVEVVNFQIQQLISGSLGHWKTVIYICITWLLAIVLKVIT